MSELQPTLDDVWRLFRETALGFQEMRRQSQDTELRFKETERLLQAQSKDTDRRIKEMTTAIGKLGNRLGDFVEDAVRPAAVRLFKERGIAVHEVYQNVSSQRGQEGIEIDLLVVNDQDVVAIECKSHLTQDDVKDHLERLGILKRLLPRYANSHVLGAVAAMTIPKDVAKYAYHQGLYVIGQTGDDLAIRNDEKFVPKVW